MTSSSSSMWPSARPARHPASPADHDPAALFPAAVPPELGAANFQFDILSHIGMLPHDQQPLAGLSSLLAPAPTAPADPAADGNTPPAPTPHAPDALFLPQSPPLDLAALASAHSFPQHHHQHPPSHPPSHHHHHHHHPSQPQPQQHHPPQHQPAVPAPSTDHPTFVNPFPSHVGSDLLSGGWTHQWLDQHSPIPSAHADQFRTTTALAAPVHAHAHAHAQPFPATIHPPSSSAPSATTSAPSASAPPSGLSASLPSSASETSPQLDPPDAPPASTTINTASGATASAPVAHPNDLNKASGAIKAIKSKVSKSRTGRRQNSSCDACRSSKKGCDLQLSVTYSDIGVTGKPVVGCSTCRRRGIECTTHEVFMIKAANGYLNPAPPPTAARTNSASGSLPSLGRKPSADSVIVPAKRARHDISPPFVPEGWSSTLITPPRHHQATRETEDEDAHRQQAVAKVQAQQDMQRELWDPAQAMRLLDELESLAAVPGTTRTISSINQGAMMATLVSRTLCLYASIMEGPMTLWLSHECSYVKPVFVADEMERRLTLEAPSSEHRSSLGSTSFSAGGGGEERRFQTLDEIIPAEDDTGKLLTILHDTKASWSEWTSSGSGLGIGLADAHGTDSSSSTAQPNLFFVSVLLDAAYDTSIDPSQAGKPKTAWTQRARRRTWDEVNEAVKAVLTAFGAQYLTSATMPTTRTGAAPLHLLAQRATWKHARDLLFPLATVPSFRVAYALLLFSSIPPPFNASVASVASVDPLALKTADEEDAEYLAERAARETRFAATRGVTLMEELIVRARKLARQLSGYHRQAAEAQLHAVSPDWTRPRRQQHPPPPPPELPAVPASLVPTLLGLLETLAWATLIFDNGHAISWRVTSTMSAAFAEECIDAAARFQGLEYYNTHAPQLLHVHAAVASSAGEELEEVSSSNTGSGSGSGSGSGGGGISSSSGIGGGGGGSTGSSGVGGGKPRETEQRQRASLALARAKAVAPRGGDDLMLSLHWANALKIYMWRQVSVLQEAVDAGVPHPAGTRAAAVLAIDIVRRHYGTFGSLVQACTQAYALLDTDAQMMLYYLILHSTLGTFHLLDVLEEVKQLRPEIDLMSAPERVATVHVSTGFVANISNAMRRVTRDSSTSASPLTPTVGHPLAPHFTPTEAPRIWNHPLLDMAFDAFLHASIFAARVWAEQLSIPSRLRYIMHSQSPPPGAATMPRTRNNAASGTFGSSGFPPASAGSGLGSGPGSGPGPDRRFGSGGAETPHAAHLCVPRSEAVATRARLHACASAMHDLTRHLPSLLSWRNATRVRQVQDECARLDAAWDALPPPPLASQVPPAFASATATAAGAGAGSGSGPGAGTATATASRVPSRTPSPGTGPAAPRDPPVSVR